MKGTNSAPSQRRGRTQAHAGAGSDRQDRQSNGVVCTYGSCKKARRRSMQCVDYGELNKQIIRKRVLMPTLEESLAKVAGGQILSKLDARVGYWQTPLVKESQE